jgi:hypothetical protein
MPRKKIHFSDVQIIDVSDESNEFIKSIDKCLAENLKSQGKGNRSDAQGIIRLMQALNAIRGKGHPKSKSAYLNREELSNPKIIEALEVLGIFRGLLSPKDLRDFKISGKLPPGCRPIITKAAEYYVRRATNYL